MSALVVLVVGYGAVWYMRSMMVGSGMWRVVADALTYPALLGATVISLGVWGQSLGRHVSSLQLSGVALDGLALLSIVLAATVMAGVALGRGPWWLVAAAALALASYGLGHRRRLAWAGDGGRDGADYRGLRPEAMRQLSPRDFELLVASVLMDQGWSDVRHTGAPHDRGADILALDPDGVPVLVQCKRYGPENSIGAAEVRSLMGAAVMVHECRHVLVVTTGRFTAAVRQLAVERPDQLTIWNADILAALIELPVTT